MTRLVIFYSALLLASLYAMKRGGSPERWMAGLFMAGAIVTNAIVLVYSPNYVRLDIALLGVDSALLLAMMIVMARADRYWPLYATAFHLLAVATHMVRVIDPTVLPQVYYRSTAWLAYPTLILLVLGTRRHHWRVRKLGHEHDWTAERLRHEHRRT